MCLSVGDEKDQAFVKKMRARGHVLVKGYKIINSCGESVFGSHKWRRGWNQAKWRSRFLSVGKVTGGVKIGKYFAGFHVYLNKVVAVKEWGLFYRYLQTVWFYADEVRAGGRHFNPFTATPHNQVLVNRVKVVKMATK